MPRAIGYKDGLNKMENFNEITILSNSGDIMIIDGEKLEVSDAQFKVDNNCLRITANYEDVVVTLPKKHYKEVEIIVNCGDCQIVLKEATIGKLVFQSNCGDLCIDAKCDDISFNSNNGSYTNRNRFPTETLSKSKKTVRDSFSS